MKYTIITSFVTIIFSFQLFSQNLYTCKSHTQEGEPIDYQREWDIGLKGKDICILLDNGEEQFNEDILFLLIDKIEKKSHIPFDSKAITVETGSTWLAYNYRITEPGDYNIYFVNSTQKKIAQQKIKVSYQNSYSQDNTESNLYYNNCQMVFCEKVVNGKAHGVKNKFTLKNSKAYIYVHLNNQKPLLTKKLIVNIWKKRPGNYDFDELIDVKQFKVRPGWKDSFFMLMFNIMGEYKISVYNEKELLIKENFLQVF